MLRRHPSTKRHTKPCKFFQTSRCPLSTEECDFAHVLLDEVGARTQDTVCRYHTAGSCGNGSRCRYRHVVDPQKERKANRLPNIMGVNTPYNQNLSVSIPPFHPPYHTMYPASPLGAWVPYADSRSPLAYSPDTVPVAHFYKPGLISPSYSGESSGSAPASAHSSLSEDVVLVTEDPKYNEHFHQHQSRIRIAEERPVVHVSPFHSSHQNVHVPVSPVSSVDGLVASLHASHISKSSAQSAPSLRLRSRSNSRYKTANYKTKPCKYFSVDGVCPNGNECTFIHEEPVPTIIDPTTQNMNAPPGLPPKPTSRQEQNRKRNYFPISWRVIGGGVLIGDPNHTSPVDGDSGSTKWPENAEGDYTERRSNEHCNDFVPDEVNSGGSPPAAGYPDLKPLRRPRSTSISRPSQVKLRSLFSAESPGSL